MGHELPKEPKPSNSSIYTQAVEDMSFATKQVLGNIGVGIDEVVTIPHRANTELIETVAENLGADTSTTKGEIMAGENKITSAPEYQFSDRRPYDTAPPDGVTFAQELAFEAAMDVNADGVDADSDPNRAAALQAEALKLASSANEVLARIRRTKEV